MIGFAPIPGLCPEQPDVAHIMLGAGMRASRDMDIHGLVQLETLLEIRVISTACALVSVAAYLQNRLPVQAITPLAR